MSIGLPLAYEGIEEAQARDLELKAILDRIRRGEDCTPYSLKNDILLCTARYDKKTKIVVPQTLIPVIRPRWGVICAFIRSGIK